MRHQFTLAVLLSLALASASTAQVGSNLIYNGEFDVVGGFGLDTAHDGLSPTLTPHSSSAADGWGVWHNTDGSTATTLLTYDEAGIPSIDSSQDRATDRLMRIEASDISNGLVQAFGSMGTGPTAAEGSVWLFVEGPTQRAGVGIGDGGATQILRETTLTGQWEELVFSNSGVPINEITLYATTAGSQFYVDRVRVSAVPEPSGAIALILSGFGAVLFRRRRS